MTASTTAALAGPPHVSSSPLDAPRPAPARRTPRRGSVLPAAAHAASLVVGYLGLLALMRGTWFRGDDFEFLANRVSAHRYSVWMPHNEHWSTGPILVWRALYAMFGMTSVLPYLAVSLVPHVLTAHLLWRLARRIGVGAWTSTALAATFVVLGAGAENITWAFQLGFMGSCALGLLALELLARGGRRALALATVAGVVGLMFSGVTVVLVGMGVAYLLVARRRRGAAVFGASCAAVYLCWYATSGHTGARPPHNQALADRAAGAAPWAWRALTSALEALLSAPGAGWLAAAALAFGVVRTLRARLLRDGALPTQVRGLLAAFLAGLAVQLVSLAVQRDDISLPDTPRYLYILIALLVPLIGLALSDLTGRPVRGLAGLLLVYLVVTQALVLLSAERPLEQPQLQADTLGLAALVHAGQPVFPTTLAVDDTDRSVTGWVRQGALGKLDAVPAQDVSDARAIAQVRIAATAPAGAVPGGLEEVTGQALQGPCGGTVTRPGERAAVLDLTPGRTVSVVAPNGGHIAYQVTAGTGPASRLISVPVQPNTTYWISSTVRLTATVVASEGQPLQLCGA